MTRKRNAWVCRRLWRVVMAGVGFGWARGKERAKKEEEMANEPQLPRNACKRTERESWATIAWSSMRPDGAYLYANDTGRTQAFYERKVS